MNILTEALRNLNLEEDIIEDNTNYGNDLEGRFDRLYGAEDTYGDITSFVEIRDDYNDNEMYQALTSMFMRVCINLHHRNDITDLGWSYYYEGAVRWSFRYNGREYTFLSAHNLFEVYVKIGNNWRRVIQCNHSHCTNAADINAVLEGNYAPNDNGNAPAHNAAQENRPAARPINEVRDIVRQAIVNELHQAVRAEVGREVRGAIAGNIGGAIDSFGGGNGGAIGHADAHGRNANAAVDDAFIERLVDAVIRALQANGIIQ